MSEEEAIVELRHLNDEINRHDVSYYELNDPTISDAAYDKLLLRAIDIAGKFPQLQHLVTKLDSVGLKKSSGFRDYNHSIPMKSLKNAFSTDDLTKYYNDCQRYVSSTDGQEKDFVVETKIDGLSLSLRYDRGRLHMAGTRGDGTVGEDVTENVRNIIGIPHDLRPQAMKSASSIEVRGEVYIPLKLFDSLNQNRLENNERVFSTPRNAAAGLLRQLNPSPSKLQMLRFFAYSLLHQTKPDAEYDNLLASQSETLCRLKELGFDVAPGWEMVNSLDEMLARCSSIERKRRDFGFDLDGAVVKTNHVAAQKAIGETSKFPKWAIAYKFTAKEASTVLRDIQVQVSRSGILTPVAVFDPVNIGGVNVQRSTLHNEDEVNRLKLYPGGRIVVKRAGDVIPKVVGLDPSSIDAHNDNNLQPYKLPSHCPACGSPTHRPSNDSYVQCTGGAICPAQAVESIK
jgi:DNA ligase (NAD+)